MTFTIHTAKNEEQKRRARKKNEEEKNREKRILTKEERKRHTYTAKERLWRRQQREQYYILKTLSIHFVQMNELILRSFKWIIFNDIGPFDLFFFISFELNKVKQVANQPASTFAQSYASLPISLAIYLLITKEWGWRFKRNAAYLEIFGDIWRAWAWKFSSRCTHMCMYAISTVLHTNCQFEFV